MRRVVVGRIRREDFGRLGCLERFVFEMKK
jgi:hypothetical protein